MFVYQTKSHPISGKNRYEEIIKPARKVLNLVEKRTKRQPYLRSAYFNKEKIFLNFFWQHINQKPAYERPSRLKLLPCAFELIEKSHYKPTEKINPNHKSEKLFRFYGATPSNRQFCVQIKENLKTGKNILCRHFITKNKISRQVRCINLGRRLC